MQELQRLLFVFSKLNPGLRYVQGMNELAAPLYYVFSTDAADQADADAAEADTFFAFVRLLTLSENRDLYCKSLDTAASGVSAVLQQCVSSPVAWAHYSMSFSCSLFVTLSYWRPPPPIICR